MSTRSKHSTRSNNKSSTNNNDNDQSQSASANDDSHSNGSSTSTKPSIDLIEKLEAITGLTRSESMQLLEACNNDIEMAISIQFGTDLIPGLDISKPSTSTSSNKSQIKHTKPSSSNGNDDDVRAPIPQKMEKLVDYEPFSVNRAVKRNRTVFDGFRDIQQEFDDTADQTYRGSKKRTLAQLFRPPIDILFNGSFDVAKRFGRKTNKWILLNIQNQEEFDCQCLNRDLWSDETVKEIIKANFIFIQIYYDSTEGQKIIHFYNVNTYPFVAIIDPRTGERMKQLPIKLDSPSFCEIITNYLSDHELPVSTDYDDDYDDDSNSTANNNTTNNNTSNTTSNGESSLNKRPSLLNNRFGSTSGSSTHHTNNHSSNQTTTTSSTSSKFSASKALEQLKDKSDSVINITSDDSSESASSNDSDVQVIKDNNSQLNKDKLINKLNNKKTNTTTTTTTNNNNNCVKKEKNVKVNDDDEKKCETAAVAAATANGKQQKEKVIEEEKPKSTQPKQIKYETDLEKRDCCLRIMMPNGDRLDFHTGGDDKLKTLVDYLKTQGYKDPKYELIERLLPQQQQQQQATTSSNCNSTDNVNQARNLFRSDLNNTFKQHNLYPRVFLLLQEC